MVRYKIILIIFLFVALPLYASEFRRVKRIAKPGPLPEGAIEVKQVTQLPRQVVIEAVEKVTAAWNTTGMGNMLDDNFYDKSQFQESMASGEKVPYDAKLSILGIESIQTVNQHIEKGKDGTKLIVSTITVTVRTQIEFNDPTHGYQRLSGTNDLVMNITHKAGNEK
jgi:hypothetical protein